MSSTGEFIKTYTYSNLSDPKKIISSYDGGFLYVCLSDRISKVTEDGVNAGAFAINTNNSYTNIHMDESRNLYITTSNTILKYNDRISIIDLKSQFDQYLWDMNDIYIKAEEYVQDWVYNRSISRMWDNIELFRRGIKGKISITQDITTGIQTLVLKGFTPTEYTTINNVINKEDIYIGVNEFVTADVINRCLEKLYNIQLGILDTID
jgi:hypothetical protein